MSDVFSLFWTSIDEKPDCRTFLQRSKGEKRRVNEIPLITYLFETCAEKERAPIREDQG